jgi:outer membrane protein assembly factor BamB
VKQQQRSLVLASAAVVATLLLVVVGTASTYFWQRSRLAYVRLESARPPLVAQLVDRQGAPVAHKATVPMQQPQEVPAGEYRLRLMSDERLSQDYDVSLTPGQRLNQGLDLEDQLLWGDFKYRRAYRTIRMRQTPSSPTVEQTFVPAFKTDLLLLDNELIQRVDGQTHSIVWELNLSQPKQELLSKDVRLIWPWDRNGQSSIDGVGAFDVRPFIVSAPETSGNSFDFNDDSVSDVVVAARHQGWILAISGKEGTPLWIAARGDAVNDGQNRQPPLFGVHSAVPYEPLIVADQNGDGVAELVVWFMVQTPETGAVVRSLELISGKTGETLWKYEPPAEYFALGMAEEIPSAYRWYYGASGGYTSGGRGSLWSGRRTRRGFNDQLSRSGTTHYLPSEVTLLGSNLAFIAGRHLVQLDCATGEETVAPRDMAVRPSFRPRWADFDRDGQADVLLTTTLPSKPAAKAGGVALPQLQLAVWSAARQSQLWRTVVEAISPTQQEMHVEAPSWPVVEDLDGDGWSEVLVPDGSSLSLPDWFGSPWGRVAVLEGGTGQPRWHRQLMNVDQQLDAFVAGPDINGDGCREIYVVSLWGQYYELFVDCLSGTDGQSLWRAQMPTQPEKQTSGSHRLGPLGWYAQGDATWPQLVVRLVVNNANLPNYVCLFSIDSGKIAHIASQVVTAEEGDFDGDGIQDLLLDRPENATLIGKGGRLHVVRGTSRETTRRLAMDEQPLADFNGDGVVDLLRNDPSQAVSAHCGLTGRQLWKISTASRATPYAPRPRDPQPTPIPHAQDLNADGVPDVLLVRFAHELRLKPVVTALSGKTGKTLWQSELATQMVGVTPLIETRDLDGDGEQEIIVVAGMDLGRPVRQGWSSSDMNLWLAVLSAKTGKTRFTHQLIETSPGNPSIQIGQAWLESSYADLDGDGTLDLLLPGKKSPSSQLLELRALSGKDGRILWRQDLVASQRSDPLTECIPPAAGDLDGDGLPEAVIAAITESPDDQGVATTQIRLTAVNGKTGEKIWERAVPAERYYAVVQSDYQVANRVRPLLVRRGSKQWVALLTRRADRHHLRLMNEAGNLASEKTLAAQYVQPNSRLWSCDVDGDDRDELIFFDGNRLCVAPADKLDQPLWTSRPDEWGVGAVKGILPDAPLGPQLVIRGRSGTNSLHGLSVASGALCWTIVGPRASTEAPGTLLRPSGDSPPLAYFAFPGVALVRQGTVMNGGELKFPSAINVTQTAVASATQDPRLLRPLPWTPQDYDVVALPRFVAWTAFYGVVLLAVPMLYIRHLIRRKQWGLKTMLLLPVVAGIFLMGVIINGPDNDFQALPNKLMVATVMAGPPMFALYQLARWIAQGRWALALVWLALGIVAAIVIGAVVWQADHRGGPFQPGEQFSWEGWYWILGPAYWAVACLMTAALALVWAGQFVAHRIGGKKRVASA